MKKESPTLGCAAPWPLPGASHVFLLSVLSGLMLMSCAAGMKYESADSYSPAPAMAKKRPEKSGWSQESKADTELQLAYSQEQFKEKSKRESASKPETPPEDQGKMQNPQEQKKPLVVYQGFLRLRVRRTIEAADAISKITQKAGGYIESLTEKVVVVRIPAGDFDAIMDKLASVGKVLDRQIKALDVTAQFTDLRGRLAVAVRTRIRLIKLFAQAQKAEERLKILKEIKRLTEKIENLKATLDSLKNLVDYFTITIELEPVMESGMALVHQSPFPWVRSLEPHWGSISDGKEDVDISLPAGFVLFDDDDTYRAQAADTTILRAGYVENEPRGDNKFWMDAVGHEMDGRDEEKVEDGTAGKLSYKVFRSRDAQPRYYLVAVYTKDDKVYVVEIFYPNPKAYTRHHKAVVKALATFRTK